MEISIKDAAITHNSMEPKVGSVAVAMAVALLANRVSDPKTVLSDVSEALTDSLVQAKIQQAQFFLEQGTDPVEALAIIGTAGYVPETVGAAFYCIGATQSFQDAVVMAVRGGGDTDTTAAIVGAMAGTWYGLEGIPDEYKDGVENFQLLQDLTDELINIEL
jgi:ADP-ribosylglycohydrolase